MTPAPVDLTTPSSDLGVRLIIEWSTDPAVRHEVATDPVVAAIATAALDMPAEQRRRVSELHDENFALYRSALSTIRHRVRHAGGPDHLTTRAVNERLHELLDCPADGPCTPYHTCETVAFTSAVQDVVYAHLARDFLTADEQRLFTTPWTAAGCPLAPNPQEGHP